MTATLPSTLDPSLTWLLDAPGGAVPSLPINTRKQLLPLGELDWPDFERLCLRIAAREGVVDDCRIYGVPGQAQGGIDILVRPSGAERYVVWQSKRYRKMTVARLKAAVTLFLKADWADRTSRFVLATTADLSDATLADAVEVERARLTARNIAFDTRDASRLSRDLKNHPDLVDDFFDRPWVEAFCGKPAARALGDRLGRADYADLRRRLADLYGARFATADPGVVRASTTNAAPPPVLPLADRYIAPDLFADNAEAGDNRGLLALAALSAYRDESPTEDETASDQEVVQRLKAQYADSADFVAETVRTSLADWAREIDRAVVIGRPGAGKSTLLRFLALDLLSSEPRLPALRQRWTDRLPIWVSFSFWTRLILKQTPETDLSLEASVVAWLKAHGESEIIPLIRRAFTDRRVVLLVDGIDEWSNEAAAGTALSVLSTWVRNHGVPAVVTSRPHGARVLQSLDASWAKFELAPLTTEQQTRFAAAWFDHLLPDASSPQAKARQATTRAEELVSEIARSREIANLAETPLMLGGLIGLKVRSGSLPRNRHHAYRELTDRMLDTHPRARATANLEPDSPSQLDVSMRRRILAELAFALQTGAHDDLGLGGMHADAAVRVCAAALETHLAMRPETAVPEARSLIAVGEESLGILVEQSLAEVGFLHRAFQEFLAAEHVTGLPLTDQLSLFNARGADPRWRDVLLFVAQATQRETDVEALVKALQAGFTGEAVEDWSRELLLCDLAFSDVKRSAPLTRSLADRFFDAVGHGLLDSQRIDILKGVITGMGSAQTAVLVKPRLETWLPQYDLWHTADALRLINTWPEDEVDAVLWRSLQSDRSEVGHAAAKALATRYDGDARTRTRLLEMARGSGRALAVSAAVTALGYGWGDHSDAIATIDAAALSQSTPIAVAGIAARVRCGRRQDRDRDRLIEAFTYENWRWTDFVVETLVAGWAGDTTLRAEMLKERKTFRDDARFQLLCRAFPGDEIVAKTLADRIRTDGIHAMHSTWKELGDAFPGHPRLVKALEAKLPTYAGSAYEVANAAKVARTIPFRNALVSLYLTTSYVDFWVVETLLDLWPSDPVVQTALADLGDRDLKDVAEAADRLPDLMGDKAACRAKLIEVLRDLPALTGAVPAHRVLKGLRKTGQIADDPKILNLAARLDFTSEYYTSGMNVAAFLEAFPKSDEAVALATRALYTSASLISVVSLTMSWSPAIRARVLAMAAPLPAFLRAVATDAMRDRAAEDSFALARLEAATQDEVSEIVATATTAVADARVARADIPQSYVDGLSRELEALGMRMAGRRLGAITAIGLIGRPDLLARLEDMAGWSIGHLMFQRNGGRIYPGLARAWPVIREGFGDRASEILRMDDDALISGFQHHWQANQAIREDVLAAVERQISSPYPRPIPLWIHAGETSGSSALRDLCLEIIRRPTRTWNEISSALTAANILASGYHEDAFVLSELATLTEGPSANGAIAALCDGWPASDVFEAVWERLKKSGEPRRLALCDPVYLKVGMARSQADQVVENLSLAANSFTGRAADGLPFWTPNAVGRIRRDADLPDLILGRMAGQSSVSEKLTFASLLSAARGLTPDLAAMCRAELRRLEAAPVAETGMDLLMVRNEVSLRGRLFDLLRLDV